MISHFHSVSAVTLSTKNLASEPSGLNIYQHIYNFHSHIVESLMHAFETHKVQVPFFGNRVDAFLDVFRFPNKFCFYLAYHYNQAESILDFENRISEYIL